MADTKIGKVVHFYDKISVAIIKLDKVLKVGDKIKFVKGEDEFEQTVDSMEDDHKSVKTAKKGVEIGIKVSQPAKENTQVYKI